VGLFAMRKFCHDKCQNADALNCDIFDCRMVFRNIFDCRTALAQQSIMPNVTWWRFDQSAKQLVVGHTTKRIVKLIYLWCLPEGNQWTYSPNACRQVIPYHLGRDGMCSHPCLTIEWLMHITPKPAFSWPCLSVESFVFFTSLWRSLKKCLLNFDVVFSWVETFVTL